MTASSLVALAIVLSLLTAWVDFVVRLLKQLLPSRPVGMGPDALWMGPIMNLLWLGVPALILALMVRRWPQRVSPTFVLAALSFVALADLFLSYRRVHAGAELILALGGGVWLAPIAARHFDRLKRWLPRAVRWALGAYVVTTAALFTGRRIFERLTRATLADSRASAPNVLLLVLDTVRSFNMSLYGYDRATTPHLAKWAAEGVRFDQVFATAPWTLPSHASMFTGRHPGELSADLAVPLDNTYPTIAETLRDEGYDTGSFVANLSYCTWQYGLTRGFNHTDGYPVSISMLIMSSAIGRRLMVQPFVHRMFDFWDIPGRKPAAMVNQKFLSWLDRRQGHPFFAFLNYYDAHQPVLPPAPFDTMFGPPPPPRAPELELAFRTTPPAEIPQRISQYDGAIAYMDQQLDALLLELARRRLLDNTIVIVTSDHGEHWGDHQRMSHGNTLYRQLLQVPLAIRFPPRFRPGSTVPEPVSLVDLPATILDIAGAHSSFSGRSFATLADSLPEEVRSNLVRPIFSANAPRGQRGPQSVIFDGLHYLRDVNSNEELYDAVRDPRDSLNIAALDSRRAALARLRSLVDSLVARNE